MTQFVPQVGPMTQFLLEIFGEKESCCLFCFYSWASVLIGYMLGGSEGHASAWVRPA